MTAYRYMQRAVGLSYITENQTIYSSIYYAREGLLRCGKWS